jgi:hypothetical protein
MDGVWGKMERVLEGSMKGTLGNFNTGPVEFEVGFFF